MTVTRKGFLRGLLGLPVLAMVGPALSQVGTSDGAAVSTFIGEEGTTLSPVVSQLPTAGEPVWTAYAPEDAGDWSGYIEAADKSWINFIDKSGRVSSWLRDAGGQLHTVGNVIEYPGRHGLGPD